MNNNEFKRNEDAPGIRLWMSYCLFLWTVRIQREDGAECGVTCGLRCQNKLSIWFKKWNIIIEEEGSFLEKCCSENIIQLLQMVEDLAWS